MSSRQATPSKPYASNSGEEELVTKVMQEKTNLIKVLERNLRDLIQIRWNQNDFEKTVESIENYLSLVFPSLEHIDYEIHEEMLSKLLLSIIFDEKKNNPSSTKHDWLIKSVRLEDKLDLWVELFLLLLEKEHMQDLEMVVIIVMEQELFISKLNPFYAKVKDLIQKLLQFYISQKLYDRCIWFMQTYLFSQIEDDDFAMQFVSQKGENIFSQKQLAHLWYSQSQHVGLAASKQQFLMNAHQLDPNHEVYFRELVEVLQIQNKWQEAFEKSLKQVDYLWNVVKEKTNEIQYEHDIHSESFHMFDSSMMQQFVSLQENQS